MQQLLLKTSTVAALALLASACETYQLDPVKLVKGDFHDQIEILAPVGGEKLCADRSYPLTWRKGNPRKDVVVTLVRYSDEAPQGAPVVNSAPEPRPNNGATIFNIAAFEEPGEFAFSIAHQGKKPREGMSGKFVIHQCEEATEETVD